MSLQKRGGINYQFLARAEMTANPYYHVITIIPKFSKLFAYICDVYLSDKPN